MLHFLAWYLTLQLIGLAALPLALRLFRNLPDRGYAFARPLGLLVAGYVLWLGASFGFLRNERITIAVLVVVMGAVGAWLWRRERLGEVLRAQRASIVATEVLFLGGLALAATLRAYSPEIATAGGEKYMEYAFINAILRTGTFPPPDPWLSGFAISYYYFGYVILAMVIKLSGVPAAIGFNLSLAALFAMTLTGAFGVVYNLTPRRSTDTEEDVTPPRGSVPFGVLGAVLVAVMGNLEGFLEVLHVRGIGGAGFWAWLDIKDINVPPPTDGGWMPTRFIWWWRASRVITDRVAGGGINEVIDEFPAFSFLLGDNHPHVLALPFVLMAVALAVNVLRRPTVTTVTGARDLPALMASRGFWRERLVPGLLLGALGFLNSWDFPTYLVVYVAAYALSTWLTGRRRGFDWVADVVVTGVALTVLGMLLYAPFWVGLQSQARGLAWQTQVKTRLPQYLVMFGPFVFVGIAFVGTQVARVWARQREGEGAMPFLYAAAVVLPTVGVFAIRGWWTAAVLTLLIAGALTSLFLTLRTVGGGRPQGVVEGPRVERRETVPGGVARLQNPTIHTLFVLALFALGFGLTLSTEFVFIRDNFGSRMNSVFKFYFQAWTLLGLASAYAAWWLLGRARAAGALRVAQGVFAAGLALLVGLGMVYPVLAGYTRSDGFRRAATLDGTQWVAQQRPDDYAAIQWLRANAQGQPRLLEAPGDGGKSYVYEGRMSAFTGLPTVLGWGGHESQWRGNYTEAGRREPLIAQIYQTTDPRQAQQLIEMFDVRYVVYGAAERERYGQRGAQVTKFERFMDTAFRSGDTTIFQRR